MATASELRKKFGIEPTDPLSSQAPIQLPKISFKTKTSTPSISPNAPTSSPFVLNALDAGSSLVNRLLGAAKSFAGTQTKNVADFAGGKLKVTPDDVIKGLEDTGKGTSKLVGLAAQGFNEGVFRIVKSASTATLGERPTSFLGGLIPSSLSASITGREEGVSTYQDIFGAADQWAKEKGAGRAQAGLFGGMAVLGALFVDNPLFGAGKGGKAAIELTEQGLKDVVKATEDDAVRTIIKASNPNLSDDVVEFITPSLRNARTEKEVRSIIDLTNSAARTAERKATKQAAKDSDNLQFLADEARKYKSADEFVQALSKKEFRYPDSIEPKSAVGVMSLDDVSKLKWNQASVIESGVKKWEKRIAAGERPFVKVDANRGAFGTEVEDRIMDGHTRFQAYKNLGIKEIPVIDETGGKILGDTNKSQLTDIYNRATKQQELPSIAKEYTPSVNLVRQIAESDDRVEVLNLLQKEFPNLTERTLAPIVKRVTRLRRTSDIEGALKTASGISQNLNKRAFQSQIPTKSQKILDKTTPRSVKQVMSDSEKLAYINNITRKIDSPEQAILAENEYDLLWQAADQKVIDHFGNLNMEVEILEDTLRSHPGENLWRKFYMGRRADPNTSIADIQASAQRKRDIRQNTGKGDRLKKYEQDALDIDSLISEMGFNDLNEAQAGVEEYINLRTRYKQAKEEIKEMRPTVTTAQALRESLDILPVVSNNKISAIDRLSTVEDVKSTYKDIAGFSGQARDVYRNFEKFFGTRYDEVKEAVLDPFDLSKERFVDEVGRLGDSLEEGIVKKFGFKRGSKESAAIQRYGDTGLEATQRMSREDLIKEFGRDKADKIIEADKWFRTRYNDLIDEINEVRRKMYPNNPSKLVAYRKDYYRHYQEIGDGFADAVRNFFDTPSGIDPNLVGISEFTSPKSRFLPFAEKRTGKQTRIDAIGGFVDYMPMFAYAKHIDPQIGVFRYLRRKLAEKAPRTGEKIEVLDTAGKPTLQTYSGIDNMLTFLNHFSNDLAGKTNPADRLFQEIVPGGRATMRALDWSNNRFKANAILGNIASAVAQVANVPVGLASAKHYMAHGMARTLPDLLLKIGPSRKSPFLKERFLTSPQDRFPVSFLDRPFKRTTDEGRKQLAWLVQTADEIGTRLIWNSHYAKATAKKMKDPVKYADDMTRRIVAGRGIGEVPLGQKSKLFQLVAPFQLEVGNLWWVLKDDLAGKKDFGGIATLLVANYLFNEAAENIRGSRVVYDPINALIDGVEQFNNDKESGRPLAGAGKALLRQGGEILANIPLGSSIAAAVTPKEWRDEILGDQNPTRFGVGPLPTQFIQKLTTSISKLSGGTSDLKKESQELVKLMLQVVLPYGGKQVEKSWEGLQAMTSGVVNSARGDLNFTVSQTPGNYIRSLLFGQYATPEARKFFDEREDLFDRVNRQDRERQRLTLEAEADWKKMKEFITKGDNNGAADYLESVAKEDPARAEKVADIAADEKKGLNGIDRMVKMLGVDNGERAKYIVEQLKFMKTNDEKADYIQDLYNKKLMSKKVVEQVTLLMQQ